MYTDEEIAERIAYMALWRATYDGSFWIPSQLYDLRVLVSRQHVQFSDNGRLVAFVEEGRLYWASQGATQEMVYESHKLRLNNKADIPQGHRMCRTCNEIKRFTLEYFHPRRVARTTSAKYCTCRVCDAKKEHHNDTGHENNIEQPRQAHSAR